MNTLGIKAIGWHSDCMAGGEEALAHLQAPGTAPYQIILLDWRMPSLDGWETTRRLCQINSVHQAPVIIRVSMHGLELLTQRSRHATDMLDTYLVKPVTASMLFDAVLMDRQMPDLDGLEACRRIRADPRMAPVPIIAMTANAMELDKQACRAAGMVDHVSKPIDLDNLIATLLCRTRALVPAAQATMEVENAVKRLGSNRAFYAKVVASFCTDAQAQLLGFEQRLEQGRAEDASRKQVALLPALEFDRALQASLALRSSLLTEH